MSIWSWIRGKHDDDKEPKSRERFEDYIDRQGFNHFSGAELSKYF